MKDTVLLSIIIPHKDSWDLLSKLLATIPRDKNFQIVLVDDGSSTPPPREVLSHPDLLCVKNDSGASGAGAARNRGLQFAAGDWLLFADADDTFMPGAFEVIMDKLTAKSDIIYFSPTSLNEATGLPSNRHTAYAALVEDFLERDSKWIRFRFHSPCSKLISRKLVQENKIRFDETIVANDLIFSLKIGLAATKVEAERKEIYCITQNISSGLSNKKSSEFFDIRFNNHVRYNRILKNNGLHKYQMSMLSMHRKALKLGLSKFMSSIMKAIVYRQPFLNSGDFAKWGRNRRNSLGS